MESFARAVDGIAAACKALDVPIVSGNVSLYNETVVQRGECRARSRSCRPRRSPRSASCARRTTSSRRRSSAPATRSSSSAPSVSTGARALGASEWLVRKLGKARGRGAAHRSRRGGRLQKLVLALARSQRLASAHDVSDGGLAVTLAECCALESAGRWSRRRARRAPGRPRREPDRRAGCALRRGPFARRRERRPRRGGGRARASARGGRPGGPDRDDRGRRALDRRAAPGLSVGRACASCAPAPMRASRRSSGTERRRRAPRRMTGRLSPALGLWYV